MLHKRGRLRAALFLTNQMFGQMAAIVVISFFGNVKNSVDIVTKM